MKTSGGGGIFDVLNNPFGGALHRMFHQLVGNQYAAHQETIDRLARDIRSSRDYEALSSALVAVYEAGFLRSVEQHKEILAKLGYQVTVVKEELPPTGGKDIFAQSEKSGV
jgi:hypothetical protein